MVSFHSLGNPFPREEPRIPHVWQTARSIWWWTTSWCLNVCALCMCAHVCRYAPAMVPMGGHRTTLGSRFSSSTLYEVESLVGSVAKLSIKLADAWTSGWFSCPWLLSCCRSTIADVGVGLQVQATAVRFFMCILGISGCHAYVDSAFAQWTISLTSSFFS